LERSDPELHGARAERLRTFDRRCVVVVLVLLRDYRRRACGARLQVLESREESVLDAVPPDVGREIRRVDVRREVLPGPELASFALRKVELRIEDDLELVALKLGNLAPDI